MGPRGSRSRRCQRPVGGEPRSVNPWAMVDGHAPEIGRSRGDRGQVEGLWGPEIGRNRPFEALDAYGHEGRATRIEHDVNFLKAVFDRVDARVQHTEVEREPADEEAAAARVRARARARVRVSVRARVSTAMSCIGSGQNMGQAHTST